MTLPRHKRVPDEPGKNDRVMRAPYNFVPLPEAVLTVDPAALPTHDCYHGDHCTGHIDLHIETETLLYTRCAYPPEFADQEVHRTPQRQAFFHHGDPKHPFIPGSSLRGMIRTLVEIIGFGKMTHVYDERLIYRAVGDTTSLGQMYRKKLLGTGNPLPYPSKNLKGGYLRKEGTDWYIAPAMERDGESFVHTRKYPSFAGPHQEGRNFDKSDIISVWLRPPTTRREKGSSGSNRPSLCLADVPDSDIDRREDGEPPEAGWVSGVLVRSGHMRGKHMHCVIYEENPDNKKWIQIPRDLWELYERDIKTSRGIPCRELKNEGDPLFYLTEPTLSTAVNPCGLVFFGPTMMFRIPYDHGIQAFIPEFIRNNEEVDLAESIFGTTERKGRVRFEDASFVRVSGEGSPFLDNDFAGTIVPKILSSPKPTSFQNYLVQPIDPGDRRKLCHYQEPWAGNRRPGKAPVSPSQGTVIRGHKLYWNKQADEESVAENPTEVQRDSNGLTGDTQHTVIRPVRNGCHFAGKIHFENLSDRELGVLLAALKLRDQDSRHRLGMGKPYGMGRLKIDWRLYLVDRKERYSGLATSAIPDVTEKAAQYHKDFEGALKRHYEEKCAGPTVGSIWQIPRLEALALLLDKKGPPTKKSNYTPLQPAEPWRNRFVLPTPHQAMGVAEHGQGLGIMSANPIGRVAKGAKVECVVLEQKTKKGGWRFQVKNSDSVGTLHPMSPDPPDLKPGCEVQLLVFSDDPKNMIFKWESENG